MWVYGLSYIIHRREPNKNKDKVKEASKQTSEYSFSYLLASGP